MSTTHHHGEVTEMSDFIYATRKGHGFTNGQRITIKTRGGAVLTGTLDIDARGIATLIASEGELFDIGGPAAKFFARPVEDAPADYECTECGNGPLTYGEVDSAGRCVACGDGNADIRAALVDRVASYAAGWVAAQEAADAKRLDVVWAVQESVKAGLSEYAAANAAGVTRQTVRAWLGK